LSATGSDEQRFARFSKKFVSKSTFNEHNFSKNMFVSQNASQIPANVSMNRPKDPCFSSGPAFPSQVPRMHVSQNGAKLQPYADLASQYPSLLHIATPSSGDTSTQSAALRHGVVHTRFCVSHTKPVEPHCEVLLQQEPNRIKDVFVPRHDGDVAVPLSDGLQNTHSHGAPTHQIKIVQDVGLQEQQHTHMFPRLRL
jgi:hypothetical protein